MHTYHFVCKVPKDTIPYKAGENYMAVEGFRNEEGKLEILHCREFFKTISDTETWRIKNDYQTAKEVYIRIDFDKALSNVEYGSSLSWDLSYGFSKYDIGELALLYSEGKHQEKILDLLTDCNFHTEAEDFRNGLAWKYRTMACE